MLTVPLALSLLTLTSQGSDPAMGSRTEKRVLIVQGTASARPWNIASANTYAHIDALPVTGFAYNVPIGWDAFKDDYGPWTQADVDGQFDGLDYSFSEVTDNFVSLYVRRRGASPADGDFFNDAAWQANVENVRLLARAARQPEHQCVGVVFDNEEYFEEVWNYPDDVAFASQYSVDEYREKARQRGAQIMRALAEEWPEVVVLTMHGPYLSAPERLAAPNVTLNQVGGPWEYELLGPFFFGMLEEARFPGQVVDGGEVYQYRDDAQFQFSYCWRKTDMAVSSIMPASLAGARYTLEAHASFGLYPYSWPDPVQDLMTPPLFEEALVHAIERADDHVWIFSEADRDFLTPGGIDPAWIQATAAARLRADARLRGPFDGLDSATIARIRALSPAMLMFALARLVGC
ncbi:MAG: hypothetical protein AAGG01_20230 [Planctomycetota bacterium]